MVQLLFIVLFSVVARNSSGFSSLVPSVTRNGAFLNPQVHHLLRSVVVANAARRHQFDDTTTARNAASENPRLSGRRNRNVGQKLRSWMENYEALLEYKRLHQHCRVPQRYSQDRILGSWVSDLRLNGRESLSSEQLKLLDKAGFDWELKAERADRLWQESYQRLIEYKEVYGDCCVPRKYKNDARLGHWVTNQRTLRNQGRLRMDREAQLDAVGFTWSLRNGPEKKNTTYVDLLWNQTFDRLLEFREEWGHCLVPRPFDEDPSLGIWVRDQRVLFKRGLLRPDRKERLEEVEFEFAPSNTDKNLLDRHWNVMFEHLVDYKATHGDTDVKKMYEEFGLGRWVDWQRQNKNSMDEQRRKQLDVIGFSWSNPRSFKTLSWRERYEELREYSTVHGTCRVKEKDNPPLARWVWHQRHRIKRGTLSGAQINMLESIGFD